MARQFMRLAALPLAQREANAVALRAAFAMRLAPHRLFERAGVYRLIDGLLAAAPKQLPEGPPWRLEPSARGTAGVPPEAGALAWPPSRHAKGSNQTHRA
mmetsp:Transcript_5763/g.18133  ORF Transcript_5763/g.18133 Transcript_5763/m.18133 type:complete len:100 (+) Transcript_5763:503-802(+)